MQFILDLEDRANLENFFFLIFLHSKRESEKEDKFNCMFQHVKALLRFVKGVCHQAQRNFLSTSEKNA